MALSLVVGLASDALEGRHNHEKRFEALRAQLGGSSSWRQQQCVEGVCGTFTLDVPITEADVDRWGTLLSESAPPPAPPNAAFAGGGFVDVAALLAMDNEGDQQQAVHKLAPMKMFDPNQVIRPAMTKVLMHRRKWLPYRQRLTVYQCRTSIIDAVLRNSVVLLTAPPGSGCTLQLPQIIWETEVFKTKRLIIVCPTTLTVQRTVQRLREERGEEATTTTVGECTPMCYGVTPGTQIVVTTPEMFVRQLLCDPILLHVGCVIFNDIHIRSPITEFSLSLLRSMLRTRDECGVGRLGSAPRVVVCCPDDAVSNTIAEYFGADHSMQLNLQQVLQRDVKTGAADALRSSGSYASPAVLYLEETMQWLTKCEEEGSFLCRDPGEELRCYVENIGVVAKIMAMENADFMSDEKFRSHWCPLIVNAIQQHSLAERKERATLLAENKEGKHQELRQGHTVVVVVAPNPQVVATIAHALRQVNDQQREGKEMTPSITVEVLRECTTSDELRLLLREGGTAVEGGDRLVLVATPIVAQTALPPSLSVGLVIDCARRSCATYNPNVDTDVFSTSYSYIQELRQRRSIARVCVDNSGKKEEESGVPAPMVLQLIPKSILHSAQHRRVSSDPAHHSIFHLPWVDYVHLYHLLQAHEEALCCRGPSSASAIGSSHTGNLLSRNVPQLVSSAFIGVASLSASRYEHLKRIFIAVENHLVRLGHLQRPSEDQFVPRLLPLGVVTTCFALPIPVLRLLVWSRLYGCVVPASVVAAIWMLGDIFCTVQHDDEAAELMRESRVFFSHGSGSDVVSAFHAYRMWLSLRGTAGESGDAFGSESFVSSETLIKVEKQQLMLLHVLEVTGVIAPLVSQEIRLTESGRSSPASVGKSQGDIFDTLASTILAMPEAALLEGNGLLQCVTAALYPQYATPLDDGSALALRFVEGAAKPSTNDGNNGSEGDAQHAVPQLAFFSELSVMSVEEVYKSHAGKPFLYLHRDGEPEGRIALLKGATPLCMDAAVVSCGERSDHPKQQASRCRGWTSVITNAWRLTKCARRLPPAAQLPPVSIPFKLYDTIQAPQVIVQLDGVMSLSMRATTAKWLHQLREHTSCRLRALVADKTWPAVQQELSGLHEAWEWWSRRVANSQAWLREERASRPASNASSAGHLAQDNDLRELLCPYYQYSSNPGRPPMVVPPKRRQGAGAPLNASCSTTAVAGTDQPTAYNGKMPDPVMSNNIQHSAKSIAKARSREQEAKFLKMYPDLFAFLDPEHEFHGYYLHVLRREAPDLEVLGDNLEELEKFLQDLEEEVREEVGAQSAMATYDGRNGDQSCFAGDYQAEAPRTDGSYQFQEVNADEYMASYGMQVESSVEHATRPPALFRTQDVTQPSSSSLDKAESVPAAASFFTQGPAVENSTCGILGDGFVEEPVAGLAPPVDNGPSSENFAFTPGQTTSSTSMAGAKTEASAYGFTGDGASGDGAVGRAPTLMEQLLAMKAGGALGPVQPAVSVPQDANRQDMAPSASTQIPGSWLGGTVAPPVINSGFGLPSSSSAMTATSSQTAAANASLTRDLLEVMGVIPPPPPVNPLTIAPPPLPAEALANRPPSVLVYPLPPREYGNIPLILAKAMGETMGIKVGPTRLVGNVGRIDVPNHKVEARALALKSFTCVGKKVYIFKNDRIVDGPRNAVVNNAPIQQRNSRLNAPRDLVGEGNVYEQPDGVENEGFAQSLRKLVEDGRPPPMAHVAENHFAANARASAKKSINPQLIGVLLDSDDDGDEESSERSASV